MEILNKLSEDFFLRRKFNRGEKNCKIILCNLTQNSLQPGHLHSEFYICIHLLDCIWQKLGSSKLKDQKVLIYLHLYNQRSLWYPQQEMAEKAAVHGKIEVLAILSSYLLQNKTDMLTHYIKVMYNFYSLLQQIFAWF